MKLSEAMILGSLMIKHVPYVGSSIGPEGCAIQCAMAATRTEGSYKCGGLFPWFYSPREVECPDCGLYEETISRVVTSHLNDRHEWPIDRIAEWVAQFEKESEPQEFPAEAEMVRP